MEKRSHLKGLAKRTLLILIAIGFLSSLVMLSLPRHILAGGGNSNVSTGSMPALIQQGTPKEAVLGSTPQTGYHLDFHNGEFRYPFLALTIPGVSGHSDRNMDIKLLFTYRSRITYNGQFGYNWDFFYYKRVKLLLNILTYYDGTGRADSFTGWDSQNNEWDTNPPGYFGKFTKDPNSTEERYKYTDEHGGTMTFDSDGRLNNITDRNGNSIHVTWKTGNNDWQIDKLTDTTGRDFTFSYYETGRLEKITDFNNREIQFSYDDNDDLEWIKLPTDNSITPQWSFSYTSGYGTATLNHNLEIITNPESQQVVRNYYETTSGFRQDKVDKQDFGDQEIYKIYYDQANSKTVYTNGSGHRREYFLNASYTNVPEKLREYTGDWLLDENTGMFIQAMQKYRGTDPDYFETQWTWNSDRQMTKMKEQRDGSTWNSVKYTYDSYGNLAVVRRKEDDSQADSDTNDLVTSYSYDTDYFNQVKTITDPKGNMTSYFYDYDEAEAGDLNDDGVTDEEKGNLVRIEYPDIEAPSSLTDIYRYFQYESTGQLKAEFNELGVKTFYEYYTANDYPNGEVKYFLKKKTLDKGTGESYLNLEYTYNYDKVGNLKKETDPNSVSTVYEVNNWNLVTKITYSGAQSPVSNYETKKEYFKTFLLKKEEVKNIDKNGNTGENQYWTTEYTYKPTGHLATKVVELQQDPDSSSTTGTYTLYYDNHYNLKKVNKPEGNDTREIKHDERELKFKEIGLGGMLLVEPPYIQYDYDYNQTVDKIKDAKGNYTYFEYDGFKRKTKEKDDLTNYTTFTYDKNSNITEIKRYDEEGPVDPLMTKTKRYFDTHNQMWKEERAKQLSPSETFITFTYTRDGAGNITKIDGPNDTDTTFTYDHLDRKLSETDDAGNAIEYEYEDCGCGLVTKETHKEKDGETTLTYVIEYSYDELGRQESVTVNDKDSADEQVTTYSYDSMGNTVEVVDAESNSKEYLYGGVNRKLLKSTEDYDASNDTVTKYFWDKNGNLTDMEDDNGIKTHYKYDNYDRAEYLYYDYVNDSSYDSRVKYAYDDNDNVTGITNQYGGSSDTDWVVITNTYDDLNQLTMVEVKDDEGNWIANGNEKLTYTYDAANRLIEAKAYDPYTTVISDVDLEYDPLGRVTAEKETLFGGTQRSYSFEYNDFGAMTNITYPNSDEIDFTRTAIHNIDQIKEGNNVLADYTWIGPYRPKEVDYYNGTDVVYGYDGYRRLEDLNNRYYGGSSIKRFHYEFDNVNNRKWEKNVGTSKYDVYTYNKAYKLTEADLGCSDSSGSNPTKTMDYYFIDELGNRDRREVYTGSWTKTYYCANEVNEYFVVKDAESAINCATEDPNRDHDDNGNLTSDPDYSFTYDYANRLVKVMDGQDTVAEYWFDALGRRIKKDDQTTVTHFYYRGAQVFEEYSYDQGETLEARYLYGDEGADDVKVMMRSESGTLDAYYYYHKNTLGSIVAVTDDSGDLAEQYTYDPYGTIYMKDGNGDDLSASAIKNPYLFTGRRYDEETGKYYYRARQYDPDTGRFMQRDPAGYVDGMNLYEYAQSNPVSRIDPFGLGSGDPQAEGEGGGGGGGGLIMTAGKDIYGIVEIMEQDLWDDDWEANVYGWVDLACDKNGQIQIIDKRTGYRIGGADEGYGGDFKFDAAGCEGQTGNKGYFVRWQNFYLKAHDSQWSEDHTRAGTWAGIIVAFFFPKAAPVVLPAGAAMGKAVGEMGEYFFDNEYHLTGWMEWKACCKCVRPGGAKKTWVPIVTFMQWELNLKSNDTEYYAVATAKPGPSHVQFRGISIKP